MPRASETGFLKLLEAARLDLAGELLARDRSGKLRKGNRLNEAVQGSLARAVFARICKERGFDPAIHGRIICGKLLASCFDHSRVAFRDIPVEMLGAVYERFLDRVVKARGRRVIVAEKPEVRKAGGVFYTPGPVVEYIVRQTVEKRLRGAGPEHLLKFRFLDPACGSGIFLIRIFESVCEHWKMWLTANQRRRKKAWCWVDERGEVRLTLALKRRILLANVFGVDLDPGAVEVARLSLYLKILEGENEETLGRQRKLFSKEESLLPGLDDNIKCGNALIDSDFNWETGFGSIIRAGGFDAIVGNPPYVRIHTLRELDPHSADYLCRHYASARRGNYDIYICFVERALGLLNRSGTVGFILPNKFMNSEYGRPLREIISSGKHLAELVHFGANQVFESATTYTCLLFLEREKQQSFRFLRVDDLKKWTATFMAPAARLGAEQVSANAWSFHFGPGAKLIDRLKSPALRLGDVADIFVGLQTSADDVLALEFVKKRGRKMVLKSKSLGREVMLEREFLHPLVSGMDVQGYDSLAGRQFIVFPYRVVEERTTLIPFPEIRRRAPATAKYLEANRKRLERRERGKFADDKWYRFGRSQNLGIQGRKKVCVPRLVDRLCAAFDTTGDSYLDNVDVGGVTFKASFARHDLRYLTGLLNSKLLAWFFPHVSAPFRGGWLSANRQFLSRLPFRVIDFSNCNDKKQHDQLVKLVNERMKPGRSAARIDQRINALVYELYALTSKDVKMIEEAP